MSQERYRLSSGRIAVMPLWAFAAILSFVNTVLFHFPFFRYVAGHVDDGANGIVIVASLALIMLAANFLAFYLIMYLGRTVGKVLMSFFFIASSVTLYFIAQYDVIIDETMMGNVFNTSWGEATSYYSLSAIWYVLAFGILPTAFLWIVRVDYGSVRAFVRNTLGSLGLVLLVSVGNITNWTWIDRNATVIGSLLMPWSYTINAARYDLHQRQNRKEEIRLPDAGIKGSDRRAMVLIIGESARRDHFSLYGYARETTPLLSSTGNLTVYNANSNATYTTGGVKAMLDYTKTRKLYEILPNYLYRTGVDVIWRTSNWGQPPLHIEKYADDKALALLYPEADAGHDVILTEHLDDAIRSSDKCRVLVVLHTSTSHGPMYCKKYPPEFERFTPVCRTVEMANSTTEEVVNAYDNTILYTDFLIHRVIALVSSLEGWTTSVMFVSDHGESLGENNLYMHGMPMAVAPKEQYEIPFIVWNSDCNQRMKKEELVDQYYVFHSVVDFLGISTPVFDPAKSLFADGN